jgi:4-amino-4-deoxy-L-arabinose transferase-like glycosyltransferase
MHQRSLILHHLVSQPLWAILLLALLLRAAVVIRGSGTFDDPDNYLPMARSLASGKGFQLRGRPTAYRPPLYPVMLAPLTLAGGAWFPWGIALLHLGLGIGTVGLTAVAAKRFGLSRTRALAAAFIVACDPVLIAQSRSVMTETPAAFLVAATLAGLAFGGLRGAVLGGLGFGLAGLCRPSLLAGAGLTVLAGLAASPGDLRQRLVRSSGITLTAGLVLLPWMIRNLTVFGEPVWTTTHGGYTLALANNPVYYRDVLNGAPGRVWSGHEQWLWWDSVNRETHGMSEPRADRYLKAQVWRLARERPGDFGRAILARLGHFWSVAPAASVYPSSVRWATFAWALPLWVALGLGLVRRSLWHWPRIATPMIVLGLSLVHAVFWTDLRMRAPIVPAIALIAAGAGLPRVGAARARTEPDPTSDPSALNHG